MYGPQDGSREIPSSGRCNRRCKDIIWFAVSNSLPAAGYSGDSVLRFIIAFAGIVNSVADGYA